MAAKTPLKKVIPYSQPKYKLTIRSTFHESFEQALEYGCATFGIFAVKKFISEVKNKLILLPKFPNANPKCRFIDSTESKTYRNIIVKSYYIVYLIKGYEITVLDLIHQSVSPDNMKNRVD
jgi:plasmid stabilization system protein ParE